MSRPGPGDDVRGDEIPGDGDLEATGDADVETRRGVIGPFTVRQLVVLGLAIVAVFVGLRVLTTPLGKPTAALPTPGASFVAFAPAQVGLRPGDRAPELAGVSNGRRVRLTSLAGQPLQLFDESEERVGKGHLRISSPAASCRPSTARALRRPCGARR